MNFKDLLLQLLKTDSRLLDSEGELMGNKLIYLEAGSGALQAVSQEMIQKVTDFVEIPVIVGGGIRTKQGIENAYKSGATMVVIGTAFENDSEFFNQIEND